MIDDVANSVGPTGARIPADGVNTGSFRRTVVVLGTLDLEDRLGGSASTTATADVTAGTHAHHSAYWICRKDPALSWFCARV